MMVVRGVVEPPTFRFSGLRMTVQGWPCWSPAPAQGSAVDRDGLRCTNMYEIRNETTNPTRALILATLVAPRGQRVGSARFRAVCGSWPRIKKLSGSSSSRFAEVRRARQPGDAYSCGQACTINNCI
jgi:hypothetical protein